MTTDSYS